MIYAYTESNTAWTSYHPASLQHGNSTYWSLKQGNSVIMLLDCGQTRHRTLTRGLPYFTKPPKLRPCGYLQMGNDGINHNRSVHLMANHLQTPVPMAHFLRIWKNICPHSSASNYAQQSLISNCARLLVPACKIRCQHTSSDNLNKEPTKMLSLRWTTY